MAFSIIDQGNCIQSRSLTFFAPEKDCQHVIEVSILLEHLGHVHLPKPLSHEACVIFFVKIPATSSLDVSVFNELHVTANLCAAS